MVVEHQMGEWYDSQGSRVGHLTGSLMQVDDANHEAIEVFNHHQS